MLKYYGPLTGMTEALKKVKKDIVDRNHRLNSVVVLTSGGGPSSDPADILKDSPVAADA